MPSLVPADKLKGVKFLPVAHTLDRYARLLRDEKRCDIIIALTHIGFSHQMDLERHTERLNGWLAEAEELGLKPFSPELWEFIRERKGYGLSDLEISRIVPGIDVIIGGHSHVGIQPPYEDPVTHTIVVQAYSRFTCVGRMDLYIDPETQTIQSYDHELVTIFGEEYVEDPEAKEWLAHEVGRVEKELSTPISYAKSVITRGDYETTLGNLITDAMCEETGADVALINRGGIRADIPAGDVTELVVYKVLPFGNTVVTIPVTGRELWEVLEAGVSGRRRDTQLSGVRILWNPTLPSGQRICSIEVNGEPLDPDGMYILATSDYLASGAIGYTVLERLSQDAYFGGITIREALVRYLKKRKEVDPQIEGRNIRAENAKMSPLMERLNREAEEAQKAEEAAGTAPPSYYTK
jgi:2',3'-cyclic-nucleotide 2'-phosphodiesterase (5'-nucleotidase family)